MEVETTAEVAAAQRRLAAKDLATAVQDEVACCYALQDKVWVDAPDGEAWEIYTVLADVEMPSGQLRAVEPGDDAMGGGTANGRADGSPSSAISRHITYICSLY